MSLISWIKFDYNTVYDLMGRTSVITEGSPTYSVGKIDYASTVTNSNGYNFWPVLITPRSFSISFWCLFPLSNSPTDWNTLLRISGSGGHHVIVQKSTNLLGVYASSAFRSSGINVTSITSGWHHVAVRINNTGTTTPDYTGTTEFFIDGVKTGNTVNYACYADTGIEGFLCYQGSSTPGSGTVTQAWGTVSDFKIWDHLLSNGEIYEESLGLIAHYPLDSSYLYEASGRNKKNPVSIGNSYFDPSENSVSKGAWYFDGNPSGSAGTADYLETEDIILFRKDFLNAEASISLWVKFTGNQIQTTSGSLSLFGASTIDSTQAFFRAYKIDASNTGFTGFYFLSGDFQSSNYSITNNTWHHIVNTVSKTDVGSGNANYVFTTYIDGVYMGTNSALAKTHRSLSLKNIGGLWGVNTILGYLSDIRMYTKVLTQTDVDNLYKRKASIDRNGNLRIKNINSFCPTDIYGCSLWIDSTKLKYNEELKDGDTIQYWYNLANNDYNFKQDTLGRRPIFKENINNGYALFDAVQFIESNSNCMYTDIGSYNSCTIFIVGKPTSAYCNRLLSGTSNQNWLLGWHSTYKNRMYNTSGWVHSPTTSHEYTTEIYSCVSSIGNYTKFYNETTLLSNNTTYTNSFTDILCLGSYGGKETGGAEFANAYIFEVIFYNRILSDNERIGITNYLSNKYKNSLGGAIDRESGFTNINDLNETGIYKTPKLHIHGSNAFNNVIYYVSDITNGCSISGTVSYAAFKENENGFNFDGTSNTLSILCGKYLGFSSFSEQSVSFWIYITTNPASKQSLINAYNDNFYCKLNTNGTIEFGARTSSGLQVFNSTSTVNLNTINHICIINKGSVYSKCYINGILSNSNTLNGNLVDINSLEIGSDFGAASGYFTGKMCNISIWNKILTDKEVMLLYNLFSNNSNTALSYTKEREIYLKGSLLER